MANNQELGSKTIILYGDSGVGKSLNAAFFARLMYEWYGRPVGLACAEGSSRVHFQPLIEAKIVYPLWLRADRSLSILRRLRKGAWPVERADGSLEWHSFDWTGPNAPCAFIGEGLGSISDLFMENMRANGYLPPSSQEGKGQFDEDGEHFQVSSRANYMKAQEEILFTIRDIDALPFKRVLWTAHEYKGKEEGGDTILGPGLAGRARTPDVPKYCSTCLHFETYPTTVHQTDPETGLDMPVIRSKRRIWWMRHPDPRSGIEYPAKVTLAGDKLAHLYEQFPGGYFEPGLEYGTGLDKFLKAEAALVGGSAADILKWKEGVDNGRKSNTADSGADAKVARGGGDGSPADK